MHTNRIPAIPARGSVEETQRTAALLSRKLVDDRLEALAMVRSGGRTRRLDRTLVDDDRTSRLAVQLHGAGARTFDAAYRQAVRTLEAAAVSTGRRR